MPTNTEYLIHLRSFYTAEGDEHTKQRIMIEHPAKRKIVRAGRRSGKTTGISRLAVTAFLKGRRVLYGGPTDEQVSTFWFEVKRALADPLEHGVYYKNEGKHIIELAGTKQRIRAKTCWDPDTLRGDTCDLLILDEYQLMAEDTFTQVGAPMIADNNGDAIFIFTPPSMRMRQKSKAKDVLHASKMFKSAKAEMDLAVKENRLTRWLALHFTSYDNPFISAEGLAEVSKDMTAISRRQEMLAEEVDAAPGALWTPEMIERTRILPSELPPLVRIVVAVDPTGSTTNECGIVAAGADANGHGYILKDASINGALPHNWATASVNLYSDMKADRIVGERNYGGDMVQSTIRTVNPNVAYRDVQATRGKVVRAEPIAAKYEVGTYKGQVVKGLIHHVGEFEELEREMMSYVPGNTSPNRMDALVWAMTELMPELGCLGLVDYFASGQAQVDMKKADDEIVKVTSAGNLVKPMVPDQAPVCGECGSPLLQRIGLDLRCQACGHQTRANGNGLKFKPMTRGEFLAQEKK